MYGKVLSQSLYACLVKMMRVGVRQEEAPLDPPDHEQRGDDAARDAPLPVGHTVAFLEETLLLWRRFWYLVLEQN